MSTQATQTDFWWPHPSAFDDLIVDFEDTEGGGGLIHLSAPDGTECADWLAYFQETPERQAAFEQEFMRTLLEHAQRITNGEIQGLPDEQSPDHPGDQEDRSGTVEEH